MKTIFKCYAIIFIIIQINLPQVYAQTTLTGWQLGFNIGGVVYQGDLSPSLIGSYKTINPVFDINVSRTIIFGLKLRSSLTIGKLSGDEGKYSIPAYRQQRNLSFNTTFKEISGTVLFNFLEDNFSPIQPKFSPYIFAGVGVSFLSVHRNSANMRPAFLIVEPESTLRLVEDLNTSPPKSIFVLPYGFGVSYYISSFVSLNAEFGYNYTRTDYLDGFSKIVNSKKNDDYYFSTMGVIYKFNTKNKLDCPTRNF